MKDILIIVDMLNDFVDPNGALYFEPARQVIKPIRKKLAAYRAAGKKVIFLADNHAEDDLEFNRFPKHAVENTWGAEVIAELIPLADEIIIPKTRYSGFHNTSLVFYTASLEAEKPSVEVCGVCTSICVMDTVGDLANYDHTIEVDVNAVADFDLQAHKAAITRMKMLYGAEMTNE